MVHVFVKKSRNLPDRERSLALARMKRWLQRHVEPPERRAMTTFAEELEEIFGPVGQHDYAEARLALEIAVQFAALRERRGLSQRELAERLGKTQQAISKIENPYHGGHNLARLKAAVAALDATLDVTIVPLEDLAVYDELRPPKPTLEDICARRDAERRG